MGENHSHEAIPDGAAAVKYQPYLEYKESGVDWLGKVPEHWNIAPLRHLLNEPLTNGLFKKREHWGSGLRIVNVFDIYIKGDVVQETSLERVCCDITEQKKYSAKHGDFFFVRSSLKLEGIGKSASVLNPTEPMVFECHLVRGRPNTDIVCPKYLNYILNSSYCRQSLISFSNQVTMTTIDQEKFKSLKISYSDLPEQQTIAAFLDYKTAKIDALIAKKKALLDKLAEKRTALISHAVTKGLDPKVPMRDSGIDWLGDIPAHWEMNRLKFLATVQPSNVDKKTIEGEEAVLLCNYTDVYKNEYIDHELAFMQATATPAEIRKFMVDIDDVIVTKDSEDPEDIAIPACVAEKIEDLLCGYHLTQIKPLHMHGRYLFRLFQSKGFNAHFIVSANGVTRFGLPQYAISNVFTPTPPISEQIEIAEYIDDASVYIEKQKRMIVGIIGKLKEYRSALITNAVTGKIDVRNFRLPEAEELVTHEE